MDTLFTEPLIRFGTSGTLIFVYGMVDGLARRAGSHRPARLPGATWMRVILFVSISAFYLLIGPAGGPLAGGWGNLAGVAGVLAAAGLRFMLRDGHPRIRHPHVATRVLFYAMLPLAVGVPLGWLALTLPATVTSAASCVRAERLAGTNAPGGGPGSDPGTPRSFRWVPGIW